MYTFWIEKTDWFNQSEETSYEHVVLSSKYIYIASINHYERILNKLQQNPYPITLDKTHRFLVYTKKTQCSKFNILLSYICALNYHYQLHYFQEF